MGTKLNQIVAIEKGTKANAHKELTAAYQRLEKRDQLVGFTKNYAPKNEEGEKLPSEQKKVQYSTTEAIKNVRPVLARMFDVVATKEVTNASAKADVVVGGTVLMKDAPVTFLLFLEKQLVDLHTFVSKLPTLAPDQDWAVDPISGLWKTPERETHRTKKVTSHKVIVPATPQHPAQVAQLTEDIIDGYWRTINLSGESAPTDVKVMLGKIEELQRAVQFARQAANNVEAIDVPVGDKILGYVFASP